MPVTPTTNNSNSSITTPLSLSEGLYLKGWHYEPTPYTNPQATYGQSNGASSSSSGGSSSVNPLDFTKLKSPGSTLNGVTSAVNNVGGSLGFGNPWVNPDTPGLGAQAAGPGTLGTSTSLTGVLSGAGAGYLAGGFLGKVGGNQTGGQIGGAIGGAAGSYAAGTALGTAVGAGANLILPGLGIVAGGLLGGFMGGKKNPHPFQGFGGAIMADGSIDPGSSYSSKHTNTDGAKGVITDLSNIMQQYAKGGVNIQHQGLSIGLDTRANKGAFTMGSKAGWVNDPKANNEAVFEFTLDKPETYQKALMEASTYIARKSGATDEQIGQIAQQLQAQQQQANINKTGIAGGPPMIAGRDEAKQQGPKFADWLKQYKTKQTEGAAK